MSSISTCKKSPLIAALTLLFAGQARAQAPEPDAPATPPKKPPYSLPWQLRPVVPATVVRSDTAFAFYENPTSGESGSTVASTLLLSYKVMDSLAPLVRLGVVSNSPPDAPGAESKTGFMNPIVGALYGIPLGDMLKLGLFLGVSIPVGSGGGDDAEPSAKAANAAGIAARSSMDNAMFAVNDFTVFPGVGLALVTSGLTVQVEATVLQLTQVRGGEQAQPDSSRTNSTAGLHVGYFIIPELSLGAEIRHQRWLSTPKAVDADTTNSLRDTTTVAAGPRVHLKLGEIWFRPGVAFAIPLDDPMKKADYKIVQLDLPLIF
jgi:hypothetical protein